jgi:hypothetical protein
LLKSSTNGALPKYQAEAIETGKDKAIGEYGNLLQQMYKRAPDRIKDFEKEVMDKLPESARSILQSYMNAVATLQPQARPQTKPKAKPASLASSLSAALKLPAITAEAVSSNNRTVKAARKTGDHTGLARLQATAIQEFGDKALLEVADFNDQLLNEDEKTHASWWKAFEDEAPYFAKRLTQPLDDEEEPEEPEDPEPDCTKEDDRVDELSVKISEVEFDINQLKMSINNTKLAIKQDEAKLEISEDLGFIGNIGGALTAFPHLITKGVGIAAEVVGALSNAEIMAITARLEENKAKLQKFEEELGPLEDELKNLEAELEYAEEELAQCQARGKGDGGEK